MSWLIAWMCHATWCGTAMDRIEPYTEIFPPHPERDDENFFHSIDPTLQSRYHLQRRSDAQNPIKFYPVSLAQSTTQCYPPGNFDLDNVISRSANSVIFHVPHYLETPRIVKYSHNCGHEDHIHPLLIDAWFGSLASQTGFAPNMHYVSPPRAMTRSDFVDFGFELTENEISKCIGSSLRYLVMDLVDGTSLSDREGCVSLRETFEIGKQIIRGLKHLHRAGIVHGNLKEEHVMVDSMRQVRFVDFSSAANNKNSDDLSFKSPWEIQGDRYSARDDVFRAIRIMASIVNGHESFISHEKKILRNFGIGGLLRWKLDTNFFFVPGTIDPVVRAVGRTDKPKTRALTRVLQFLSSVVSQMNENSSDIPYDEIILTLTNIERRLSEDGPTRVRFTTPPVHRNTF